MTTRSFLALSLSLPLVLGIASLLMPSTLGALFAAPLIVGGVPYIPIAILFAYLIKRSASMKRLVLLTLLVPMAFAIWLAVVLLVLGYVWQSTRSLEEGLYIGLYGLLFGYFYVLLAWVIWIGARSFGLVRNEFAT